RASPNRTDSTITLSNPRNAYSNVQAPFERYLHIKAAALFWPRGSFGQGSIDQPPAMERYICIHCHFYQPARENPSLEFVEVQDSAYPFHDWNERITAECYAPNAASRILNGDGRISRIANNYSQISFNFGPTLLSWMQANSPEVYKRILSADKESAERFSGHGSAIAQA